MEKVGTTPQTPDATHSDKEQRQPAKRPDYAQYVVSALKAVRKVAITVVNWLDEKAGFVTAVATVLIAILTGFYVHYSRAQWKAMRDQLPELQKSAKAAQDSADAAKTAITQARDYFRQEQRPTSGSQTILAVLHSLLQVLLCHSD